MSIDESVDPRQLADTHSHIRGLVEEIGRMARESMPPEAFFAECLNRVVEALAAVGGFVWMLEEGSSLRLVQHTGAEDLQLHREGEASRRHRGLLAAALQKGDGMLVGPHTSIGGGAENASECLVLLAPVKIESETRGLVEIFQRPGASLRAQRNYLRFVIEVSELATTYFEHRERRALADRHVMWQQLDPFIRAVHASLDSRELVRTIANEGRRLLGCDRVSVARCNEGRCKISSISGQETFDKRAAAVRLMNALVTKVVAGGEPITYTGETADMPPQVEEALTRYVDETHCERLVIVPLRRQMDENDPAKPPAPAVAAIVVEWLDEAQPRSDFDERLAVIAHHSGTALANAREHEHVFMLPLWRAIGRNRWLLEASALPTTTTIGGTVALAIAAMFIVPWKFTVSCNGTLEPVGRREVFAPVDGTVSAIHIKHGDRIEQNAPLVELRNTDLEVAISDITGQRMATQEQILAVDRARNLLDKGGKSATPEERNRLEGQRSELRQKLVSLDQQIEVYRQKRDQLKVMSPIGGEVTTWNVEHLLRQRPVRQGQVLVSVADTAGAWELELRMPEHRMGELADAEQRIARGEPVRVTYRLATAPGTDYEGWVTEIHRAAELRGDDGNTVLLRVKIDKDQLAYLRPGADVTAKVDCGMRSIGYVCFHDVIAFVQSRILFYL